MSYYDNAIAKMVDFIFEDLVARGNYEDTEEYSNLIGKVDEIIENNKLTECDNTTIHECNFEASRQFFTIGFLRAVELFNLDLTYNKKKGEVA